MSAQSTTLFNLAEVAFASYSNLQTGSTAAPATALALVQIGMSTKQAVEFAKRYTDVVVPTYHDPASDLDVTVFKDAGGNLTQSPKNGYIDGLCSV